MLLRCGLVFAVDFLVGLVCDLRLIIVGWLPVWFGLVFVCIGCVWRSCDYGIGGSLFHEFGFMFRFLRTVCGVVRVLWLWIQLFG